MADPNLYIHPSKDPDEFINYKSWLIEALQNFLLALHKLEDNEKVNRNLISDFAEKVDQVKYWLKYYQNDQDLTEAEIEKLHPLCQEIYSFLNLSLDKTPNGPSFFQALDQYNNDNKKMFISVLDFLLEDNRSYLDEILIPDIQSYIQDIIHLS